MALEREAEARAVVARDEAAVIWALAIASVLGGLWYASVRLFPYRDCPRCEGKGRVQGGGGIHRDCGKCGAKGRVRRLGAPGEGS